MNTSPTTTRSETVKSERIPIGEFGYMRARNKHRLYSLVIEEFKKSRISQADLARRLGKGPDIVSRWLAAPGNWRLDTVSDLLFAISGAELNYGLIYPLNHPSRNDTWPDWLDKESSQQGALLQGIDFDEAVSRKQTGSSIPVSLDAVLTVRPPG